MPVRRTMTFTAECDRCGAKYQPELVAVPTDQGGEYQSFTCPSCQAEYPVCTITKYGLSLREEINHLRKQLPVKPHMEPLLRSALKKFERECRKLEKTN
jgi:NAD-dependent SIR2 family protein deacetylase